MKKIAVGNMGEEELERVQRTVLTREETRAEADLLFGDYAKDMRKVDYGMLSKLFVQTPAAVTMAPNLQKQASIGVSYSHRMPVELNPDRAAKQGKIMGGVTGGMLGVGTGAALGHHLGGTKGAIVGGIGGGALGGLGMGALGSYAGRKGAIGDRERMMANARERLSMIDQLQKERSTKTKKSGVEMLKLASMLVGGPDGGDTWLTQFEGTSLLPQAIQLEEQSLQFQKEDMERRLEDDMRYAQQDQERKAHWQKNDQIMFQKRVLALELAKEKAGLGAQQEQPAAEEMPQEPMQEVQPEPQAAQQPLAGVEKTSSITPRVDAFFEKLSAPTDAQRRYPELLKVADSGLKKVPNLKPRVTTGTSGPAPVRADISGGSA